MKVILIQATLSTPEDKTMYYMSDKLKHDLMLFQSCNFSLWKKTAHEKNNGSINCINYFIYKCYVFERQKENIPTCTNSYVSLKFSNLLSVLQLDLFFQNTNIIILFPY
jgi:hypothetical protein